MSCGIQILKIPFECEYIVQGDTIAKTSFEVIEDGLDLTAVGVEITLQVKHGSENIIDISIGNGITVLDATHFEIDKVPHTENNLPIGTFEGDLKILDTNSDKFTYNRVSYSILKKN